MPAPGPAARLNTVISTVGTYPNEVAFKIEVTDAGAETSASIGNSRIRVSIDGGNSWIYDTGTDPELPTGFRFPSGEPFPLLGYRGGRRAGDLR